MSTRPLTLWRVWLASDMAQTDHYTATRKEALEALWRWDVPVYDLKPDDILSDCLSAEMWKENDEGVRYHDDTAYLERIEVVPTRAGIAYALSVIPHR